VAVGYNGHSQCAVPQEFKACILNNSDKDNENTDYYENKDNENTAVDIRIGSCHSAIL